MDLKKHFFLFLIFKINLHNPHDVPRDIGIFSYFRNGKISNFSYF